MTKDKLVFRDFDPELPGSFPLWRLESDKKELCYICESINDDGDEEPPYWVCNAWGDDFGPYDTLDLAEAKLREEHYTAINRAAAEEEKS